MAYVYIAAVRGKKDLLEEPDFDGFNFASRYASLCVFVVLCMHSY